MIDAVALLAFVRAALALNLTPGADMAFCRGQGMKSGLRRRRRLRRHLYRRDGTRPGGWAENVAGRVNNAGT